MVKRQVYDKLVRDNIPDVIRNQGHSVLIRYINDDLEMDARLALKLFEEIQEFNATGMRDIGEFADIMAVMEAIQERRGWSKLEVDEAIAQKEMVKGGFKSRIMLLEVIEDGKSQCNVL